MSDYIKKEIIFADGFSAKSPASGAPDTIVANASCRVSMAIETLKQHESNDFVNLTLMRSKKDKEKLYWIIDNWKPTQGDAAKAGLADTKKALEPEKFADDDIPF